MNNADLEAQLAASNSFIDDWNQFFPDSGPREISAKLEAAERNCLELDMLRSSLEAQLAMWKDGIDNHMPQYLDALKREDELKVQLADCQRELHLVKADDPEGAAFGAMVLHVMAERDALRETMQYIRDMYNMQYGFADQARVVQRIDAALAATKEVTDK